MIDALTLIGWTFIAIVVLAFITIYIGENLND